MRYLVTGGAGFVGSHLVDRIVAEGHDVDVVDDLSSGHLTNLAEARSSGRVRFHHIDVRAPELFELAARLAPDRVFHLVGPGHPAGAVEDPIYAADVGLMGLLVVLEAVRALPDVTRVVVALPLGAVRPALEPSRGDGPHGSVARAMADAVAVHADVYGLWASALALATVYGPRQRGGLVDELVVAATEGRPARVEGQAPARDLVFVDDAVDALVRAADTAAGHGELVAVGTGRVVPFDELVAAVAGATGQQVEVVTAPARVGDPQPPAVDPSDAGRTLGWSPFTTLADGLGQTAAARAAG